MTDERAMPVRDVESYDISGPDINKPVRRGDGGTYLVVADETKEFEVALRYASRMAESARGHVCILYVIEMDDVQEWSNVEAIMRHEMRESAEKFIWSVARRVNDLNRMIPGLYIREGNHADVIVDVLNEDETIKMLVLGGGTQSSGPGALVTYFTGKGLGRIKIPVLVIPGYLEPQKIDVIS